MVADLIMLAAENINDVVRIQSTHDSHNFSAAAVISAHGFPDHHDHRLGAGGGPCASIFYRLVFDEASSSTRSFVNRPAAAELNKQYNSYIWGRLSAKVVDDQHLAAILILVAIILYVCYKVWMHRWVQRDSKDPKTWPFLGSQLEAARNYDTLIDWITGFFSEDHRTVKMSFLSRRSYLTVDPANVEYILKTNFQNYPKGEESHHRLFDLLGNGILNTDGSTWRSHRKLGSLEFSIKKLRHLSSTVYKSHALKLAEALMSSAAAAGAQAAQAISSSTLQVQHHGQGGGRSYSVVDVQELLLAMTFHSICEVVFGSAMMQSGVCEQASDIASALDNVQEMITRRYVFPWWRMLRFLNMGSEKVLRQEITRFNAFLETVIEYRMSQMHRGINAALSKEGTPGDSTSGPAEDMLSRFILQHQSEGYAVAASGRNIKEYLQQQDEDGMKVVKDVREAVMSFVMAGRDTTASTLTWFLYCMCTNPDKQEEVFKELKKLQSCFSENIEIMDEEEDCTEGEGGCGGNILKPTNAGAETNSCSPSTATLSMQEFAEKVLSFEALQSSSTPYLHAALAETLRLYPPVPRDGKVAFRDDVLPDGTQVRAGDQVAYIPYAMGRMPFLWGSDALRFKPERWLDGSSGAFQPQSPFKFTAFQAGPRMCLGKDAAYLQIKITAALLLRFFRFELVPDHPVQYRMMMIMTLKHGLRVKVTPRLT